jgi:hypothetical protein
MSKEIKKKWWLTLNNRNVYSNYLLMHNHTVVLFVVHVDVSKCMYYSWGINFEKSTTLQSLRRRLSILNLVEVPGLRRKQAPANYVTTVSPKKKMKQAVQSHTQMGTGSESSSSILMTICSWLMCRFSHCVLYWMWKSKQRKSLGKHGLIWMYLLVVSIPEKRMKCVMWTTNCTKRERNSYQRRMLSTCWWTLPWWPCASLNIQSKWKCVSRGGGVEWSTFGCCAVLGVFQVTFNKSQIHSPRSVRVQVVQDSRENNLT